MAYSDTRVMVPFAVMENAPPSLKARTENAFAEEERQGLMLAAKARSIAVTVFLLWQAVDSPYSGLAHVYVLSVMAIFAILGLLQYVCARQRFHMAVLKYVFVFADCLLLALVLTIGVSALGHDVPPALIMNGSNFTLFFVFLMQAAFSFRPSLVLWSGMCIIMARTGMLLWVISGAGIFTNFDLVERNPEAFIEASENPNFVYLGNWMIEIIVSLIVAGGLAVVVRRSRLLVESRSMAERARANLARYFSPNVVDRLSGSQELFPPAREQTVAVLFADIIGFTQLCERAPANEVISLLRDYHNRLGQAVFDNGGTLDKYIGDGLMATFGTPEPGPHDARNALLCAMNMVAALETWNAEREISGAKPIRVGIGLHYGSVIAGNIGNERRLEYSVIGDTVNIASRLEHLTRALKSPLVISESLVQAINQNRVDEKLLLLNFSKAGVQQIRGRKGGIQAWVLRDDHTFPARSS